MQHCTLLYICTVLHRVNLLDHLLLINQYYYYHANLTTHLYFQEAALRILQYQSIFVQQLHQLPKGGVGGLNL